MRAILPGRPQSKRQTVCTAYWDGLRLVAYVSGNTAIVLSGPRNIIQTLNLDSDSLTAITIEESSGKLALCDKSRIFVYNPVGREQGDLRWSQAHILSISDDALLESLSWGPVDELLASGTKIWLYQVPYIGAAKVIWEQTIASPISMAYFSNDAELIASCGHHDRLVKLWRRLNFEQDSTRFDVSYLAHPTTVTNLHWRKLWHREQNLDNLLYTFCADNQLRVWAYSDPHSLTIMQLVATIDMNVSIQPRRLSVGSMSRRRYTFILDSRDFSRATEKALQRADHRQVDYALEHLVEVANRSPEICVVLDGLRHMSVWGLENAGYKNKKPSSVFNVALVDDVDIQLNFDTSELKDYVQFHAFAGGSHPSSLSILVHSFNGQIDWYEGPISHFFDPSPRVARTTLVSSWSGHDLPIDHIARGSQGDKILSWTDEGQGIVWAQAASGALCRRNRMDMEPDVAGVMLLEASNYAISAHDQHLAIWDLDRTHAMKVTTTNINHDSSGLLMFPLHIASSVISGEGFGLLREHSKIEIWYLELPSTKRSSDRSRNSSSRPPQLHCRHSFLFDGKRKLVPCDFSTPAYSSEYTFALVTARKDGQIHGTLSTILEADEFNVTEHSITLTTNISTPDLSRATASGKIAMTSANGRTLYIWDLRSSVLEWQKEFTGLERIQKLAWTSTSNGNLLLFVSFNYSALVIGQSRYTSHGESAWMQCQEISVRDFTTNPISDVSWLRSNDLAIGTGNQIFVLETALTPDQGQLRLHAKGQSVLDGTSVGQAVDMSNSILPIYHPDILCTLSLSSELRLVRRLIWTLYEQLKYFSQGDTLHSFLEYRPEIIVSSNSQLDSNNVTNGHTRDTQEQGELSEQEDSLKNYLDDSHIWQLSRSDKDRLSNFISSFIEIDKHKKSFDDNALRYLQLFYTTPQKKDLPWKAFIFASRSMSQEALLDFIARHYDNKLTWNIARRTGIFVWLSDQAALQVQLENVARMEYTKHEDRNPVDCSLYYLALNKKSVLQGLWRRTVGVREKENTLKLLANNFDDKKWKATALKNAYALLSKRRFEYGAAFFLLGGSLKDAVNVCVNQLNDVQLAIAIIRVWDKDADQADHVLNDFLLKTLIPNAVDDVQGRWIASWAYLTAHQAQEAIQGLVKPLHELMQHDIAEKFDRPVASMSYLASDPDLIIWYGQLREILVKQNKWTAEVLSSRQEWEFVMANVRWYTRAGMDLLALKLVAQWTFVPFQTRVISTSMSLRPKLNDKQDETSNTTTTNGQPNTVEEEKPQKKPPPTQFIEPSADSLLDSFGF